MKIQLDNLCVGRSLPSTVSGTGKPSTSVSFLLYGPLKSIFSLAGMFSSISLNLMQNDCKEIQPVHPKGDQSWIFTGRTDVEAETPILWPPDVKSWLIGKDPDAGKDWRQEEKGTTEDEMVGWHHRLNGCGFGWTLEVADGQGGLVCWDSWGLKESDTTEWLNWTEMQNMNFLGGSTGKESTCNAGDLSLISGLGISPGGGHGNPLQYFCLENSHGQRSLVGCSPWGCKELDTTERLSTMQNIHISGERRISVQLEKNWVSLLFPLLLVTECRTDSCSRLCVILHWMKIVTALKVSVPSGC